MSAQAPAPMSQEDRPARLVGLFTARKLTREEIPRLVEFCSQAYAEDQPGASIRLMPAREGESVFRLEATPGTMLTESEIIIRLHDLDDPASDHPSLFEHLKKLDDEIGQIALNSLEGAQSYVAVVGTRLLPRNRIDAYLNVGTLIGSALGALFIDPAAVMVTTDPGEWAEGCEQSLSLEGAMASIRHQ